MGNEQAQRRERDDRRGPLLPRLPGESRSVSPACLVAARAYTACPCPLNWVGKHGATAQELFNQLDLRANGHADLAANANAAAVTQAIDQFADILDDVVEWWS